MSIFHSLAEGNNICQIPELPTKCGTLAKLLSGSNKIGTVCPQQLEHEMTTMSPVVPLTPGSNSKTKWLSTYKAVRAKRASTRVHFPDEALKPSLCAMGVWVTSTSSIEHQFTKLDRVITSQQGSMSEEYEEALSVVIGDGASIRGKDLFKTGQE